MHNTNAQILVVRHFQELQGVQWDLVGQYVLQCPDHLLSHLDPEERVRNSERGDERNNHDTN